MQRNSVETLLGAAVLAVAFAFAAFFYRTAGVTPAEGYTLTARFTKIDGLETGAPVRLSGVKVGQVTGFALDPKSYAAVVTMTIQDDVRLPRDTAAVVASAGLLDGKFMTLEPGSDEALLKDGDRIAYTQSTASLEQLLGQVIFSLNKDGKDDKSKSAPKAGR